jgi:flagellar biosynthesis chaperone FliJ
MKPRTTWPLLVKKAEDTLSKRRKEFKAATETMQKLEASRQRLLDMFEAYKAKLTQRQQESLAIADTTNFREFMSQLLRLVERVEDDLKIARSAQQHAKQRQTEAEMDLFKMEAMVEKDEKAVALYRKQLEQRQMDALGITLHNLKNEPNPVPASGNTVA